MNYGQIYYADCANGIGMRTDLFVSGCRHHCEGCFQPETWNFDFGEAFTEETENMLIDSIRPDYIDGMAILGGEPMEPENQRALLHFYRRLRTECPGKTTWVYTGYLWEELTDPDNTRCRTESTDEILSCIDVLVDGKFQLEKKNISLRFRGSENQRIIDVPASLERKEVILTKYM